MANKKKLMGDFYLTIDAGAALGGIIWSALSVRTKMKYEWGLKPKFYS